VQSASSQPEELPPLEWLDPSRALGRIERLDRPPSALTFQREYVAARRPVVIRGLMERWPALVRWTPDYLRRTYGDREVRVQRTDDRDTTRYERSELVPFAEFLDGVTSWPPKRRQYLTVGTIAASGAVSRSATPPFRGLEEDISVPGLLDPSWLVNESNVWIGYHGVRSNLHFDAVHNILCVVAGAKRIALFHPSESGNLYPRPFHHSNPLHSDVDVIRPDHARFPRFREARYVDDLLEPGDAVYIPPGYWHYVCSRGLNVAVNFSWVLSRSLVLGAMREWLHPPVHRQAFRISVVFLQQMRHRLHLRRTAQPR